MSRADVSTGGPRQLLKLLVLYAGERLSSRVIWMLIVTLAVSALVVGNGAFALQPFTLASVRVALLVLAFRIWDDLADREHDRRTHPERIMLRSGVTAPFVALALLLLAIAIGTFDFSDGNTLIRRVVTLGVTMAIVAIAYLLRPIAGWGRAAGCYAVLLK